MCVMKASSDSEERTAAEGWSCAEHTIAVLPGWHGAALSAGCLWGSVSPTDDVPSLSVTQVRYTPENGSGWR